jgi:ubiquinone/menaquinone biosynthesis C-methylase UbiE
MLNPAFPAEAEARAGASYVLPSDLAQQIASANESGATGAELRLQQVYGDELWARLGSLGLGPADLEGRDVLDACCGTGFVSYHVLRRVRPRSLTLMDVSPEEVMQAERLLCGGAPDGAVQGSPTISFCTEDLARAATADMSFDVVVGNSFLHHFANVPLVLERVYRMLRPGGVFVGLHEPTPAAVAWESAYVRPIVGLFGGGQRWMDRLRPPAGTVRPGYGDAWLFEVEDVAQLLRHAGFTAVVVRPRYLLRPLLVALLGMYLTPQRPHLYRWQAALLRGAIAADAALARIAPARWFGGLCFRAHRP